MGSSECQEQSCLSPVFFNKNKIQIRRCSSGGMLSFLLVLLRHHHDDDDDDDADDDERWRVVVAE